jgi:transcriptional regulator with XRE-family HTH domain
MTQDAATHSRLVPQWTVGDRLRKARELTGMTQQQWADEIGVSRGTVANYEAERQAPKRPVLLAWSMAAGVELAWLRDGISETTDQKTPENHPVAA